INTPININLFQEDIFAFTPKGEIIPLSRGDTALDFAYRIHSQIGNGAVGVKINGKAAKLSQPLETGDMVEVKTQKDKKSQDNLDEILATLLDGIKKEHFDAARKQSLYACGIIKIRTARGIAQQTNTDTFPRLLFKYPNKSIPYRVMLKDVLLHVDGNLRIATVIKHAFPRIVRMQKKFPLICTHKFGHTKEFPYPIRILS
ncbi:MAG: RelA/SpoT family protein, partial [Candidatus Wolfebacteria bacterium GW2011_GWA1_47_6]